MVYFNLLELAINTITFVIAYFFKIFNVLSLAIIFSAELLVFILIPLAAKFKTLYTVNLPLYILIFTLYLVIEALFSKVTIELI